MWAGETANVALTTQISLQGRKWVFHVYGFQDTWVEGGGRERRCIEPQPGNQPRPAYVSNLTMSGEHFSIFCGAFFQTVVFWLPLVSESQTSKSAMPLRPVTIASVRRIESYSGASQLQVVWLASYSGYVGTMLETWCYTHEKGHRALHHPHAAKQHGVL